MNKEKGTRSSREMLRAYLDLNNGVFKVDEVNDAKFHVVDQTIPYDQCVFDLEVKSGRVTCNGTDCIENMKSAFEGDAHMLEKIKVSITDQKRMALSLTGAASRRKTCEG